MTELTAGSHVVHLCDIIPKNHQHTVGIWHIYASIYFKFFGTCWSMKEVARQQTVCSLAKEAVSVKNTTRFKSTRDDSVLPTAGLRHFSDDWFTARRVNRNSTRHSEPFSTSDFITCHHNKKDKEIQLTLHAVNPLTRWQHKYMPTSSKRFI